MATIITAVTIRPKSNFRLDLKLSRYGVIREKVSANEKTYTLVVPLRLPTVLPALPEYK